MVWVAAVAGPGGKRCWADSTRFDCVRRTPPLSMIGRCNYLLHLQTDWMNHLRHHRRMMSYPCNHPLTRQRHIIYDATILNY